MLRTRENTSDLGKDYNFGNVIFLFSFLLAELPSQLVSKKIGPDRWIPIQITLWSVVAMSQCAMTGKKGFYATRSILGLLEVCRILIFEGSLLTSPGWIHSRYRPMAVIFLHFERASNSS